MIIGDFGLIMIIFAMIWFVKVHLIDFNDRLMDFEPFVVMSAGVTLIILEKIYLLLR